MRLLRLELGPDGTVLDLHPFVTVCAGLDPAHRQQLAETIGQLAAGSTAGIRGLIEHEGVLLELDGTTVAPLGPPPDGFRCVLGRPTGAGDAMAAELEVATLRRRAEIAAVMVEEIRADLDPGARWRLTAVEANLAESSDLATYRAVTSQVRHALDAVAAVPPTVSETEPAVADLQRRWVDHEARSADAAAHLESLKRLVVAAEQRLTAAEAAVTEASAAAAPILLSRAEEARLEALAFPEDSGGRRRRRREPTAAETAEMQELLGRVGVNSYTEYTMYRTGPKVSPAAQQALELAQRIRDEAAEALVEAWAATENDPVTAEMTAEASVLRDEARLHLGPMLPSDLGGALRQLSVEHENPEYRERIGRLAALLDALGSRAGTTGDGGGSPAEVLTRTRTWLAQRRDPDAQVLAAAHEARARLMAALHRHQRAVAAIAPAEDRAVAAALELAQAEERLAALVTPAERPSARRLVNAAVDVMERLDPVGDGPRPVVVFDPLAGLDNTEAVGVLEELAGLTNRVQLILVSDRPVAAVWARHAGLERALLTGSQTATRRFADV
ncbi:MAG: hypothetical protein ACK5PP_01310 [Acidimicrobiales bacterium]